MHDGIKKAQSAQNISSWRYSAQNKSDGATALMTTGAAAHDEFEKKACGAIGKCMTTHSPISRLSHLALSPISHLSQVR